ncbi:TRAF2 and NCK-interacting protein kinase [Chelonia mydas]|uniref:TRAF2 and NCK-interacting protein kinase n=1 Tax=Chelonia mydas TaxID=8469 RepID=M7AWE4_CHEMY|nr:TRAF2 and NCK-interacting protein kinase [Chelonia mydas]
MLGKATVKQGEWVNAVVPKLVLLLVQGKPLEGRAGLFTCRVNGSQYVPPTLLPAAPIGLEQRTAATVSCNWPNLRTRQDPAGIFELVELVGNGTYGQVYKPDKETDH